MKKKLILIAIVSILSLIALVITYLSLQYTRDNSTLSPRAYPPETSILSKKAQILLESGDTNVIPDQRWDFEFRLPSTYPLATQDDSGSSRKNKLVIQGAHMTLTFKAVELDINTGYYRQPRANSIINSALSSNEISRVLFSESGQASKHIYVTHYREGLSCHSGEGVDPYATEYCADSGILDKLIYVECIVSDRAGLLECDDVMKQMSVVHSNI